jgi:hypothetical protein
MVGIGRKIKYQKAKCKNTYQNSKCCGEGQGQQNAIADCSFFAILTKTQDYSKICIKTKRQSSVTNSK